MTADYQHAALASLGVAMHAGLGVRQGERWSEQRESLRTLMSSLSGMRLTVQGLVPSAAANERRLPPARPHYPDRGFRALVLPQNTTQAQPHVLHVLCRRNAHCTKKQKRAVQIPSESGPTSHRVVVVAHRAFRSTANLFARSSRKSSGHGSWAAGAAGNQQTCYSKIVYPACPYIVHEPE